MQEDYAMPPRISRREAARRLGVSMASLPLLMNLPSLGWANTQQRRQRMIVVFSPNGTLPEKFWPDEEGEQFNLKPIMESFEPFKQQLLVGHGLCDKIRGDGDNHMRGIGCLLTGDELFPGNIQGGSDTPAGWASGISIDQEIKNFLQQNPATQTRFGSLEFGVGVPDRADTWTRMSYSGPNKPIAPIDNPYQMFDRLYGRLADQDNLRSVLDGIRLDLQKMRSVVSNEDRKTLEEHETLVRELEQQLQATRGQDVGHAMPVLDPGVRDENDNLPALTRMQTELLVNAMVGDFARIATFQFTNSVGQARMKWVGVEEDHHNLSHEPDDNAAAQEKLLKINRWYAEQIAYLCQRLADTPEPGGAGSMLDNTVVIWTNELGKGNSHTLDNIPFVFIGGGMPWKMGRSLKFGEIPHNRLLLSLAHGFGHSIEKFGNPDYCQDGPLPNLS
jgi:hypothetical protein